VSSIATAELDPLMARILSPPWSSRPEMPIIKIHDAARRNH